MNTESYSASSRTASPPSSLPSHYKVIAALLPSLASLGISTVWLPPGCKASNPKHNGYDLYDLYDIGEFDWKGSRATKWGEKDDLVELGKRAEEVGIGLLWDAVLNHRAGADGKEKAVAVTVDPKDRNIETSATKEVETWTKFLYPNRNGKYSDMKYSWEHFSGIDWDALTRSNSILKFVSSPSSTIIKPGWSPDVSHELGNYDYLMFADLDYTHPSVQTDVLHWVQWLPTQLPSLSGYRLDAIKHYSARFQYQLIHHLRNHSPTASFFVVGEYWTPNSTFLSNHIDRFAGHLHLFDVKLLYNLHDLSTGKTQDLRTVFSNALVTLKPYHAVTFVTNHDTQASQSLAAPVAHWFQPHAYALILLRCAGIPCVFHGDIFGTLGPQPTIPAAGGRLMRLVLARKLYAYGPQHDFFSKKDVVAWSREGHLAHAGGEGLAVVANIAWRWRELEVFVGLRHRGEVWTDLMGWSWDEVRVDEKGWGVFRAGPRSIAVFTSKEATGRNEVDELVYPSTVDDIVV